MQKTRIEWCDRTWNPVTECRTDCPYCYASTFHVDRLDEPQKIKKPQNIFVCSMADLFGEWVPDDWIKAVFDACAIAPQHRYLFLTKEIHAYDDNDIPTANNFWYGQTWDCKQTGLSGYPEADFNTFLSIEPLLSDKLPMETIRQRWFDWVIVGAETGNRKGKVTPERKWIESIVNECRKQGVPVFMKNSLRDIWGEPLIQEYPWGKEAME